MVRFLKAGLKKGFEHHFQFNPADFIASEEVVLQNKDGSVEKAVMVWVRGLAQPVNLADPDRDVQEQLEQQHKWGNYE